MGTHTPGPWSDPVNYGASKFEVQGQKRRIATVDTIQDARLIAAAPELLEAAKLALRYWLEDADPKELPEQLDKIRATIAKATQ